VAAVIQVRDGASPDLESVQEHCRLSIARYKVPREVHVVPQMERSPSGKPDYRWALNIATSATTS
jgi:3-oxocholest-4-en-26-oate---CoA ligase